MKTIQGKITISCVRSYMADDRVEVRLIDESSHVQFAEVRLSLENYARLITGLGHVECEIEVRGLDKVGKRKEWQDREIECPLKTYDRKELEAWLAEHGKVEGWLVDNYLGSRGNCKHNPNGGYTLRYTIYRYVDEEAKTDE